MLDLAQLFQAAPVAGKSFQSLRRNMTFHVVVERFVGFEDRPLKLLHEGPRQPSLREDRDQGLAGVALDVHGGNDPLPRADRGQHVQQDSRRIRFPFPIEQRHAAEGVFRQPGASGRLQNGNPKRRTRERKKSHEAALIPDDGKAYVFISLDAVEQRACIAWRVIDVVLRRPAAKVLPRRHQHGQSVTAENLSFEAKIPSRNLQHRATLFRSPSAWHMSR